jgi:histidinol-phosphate aminotransferase
MPGYRPGRISAAGAAFKLSSNENPYPPLPAVLAVIAEAANGINRYPDPSAASLIEALAEHLRVPGEDIALGTGAIGVIQQLLQATTGPGDEVVYPWRSFEAYPILVQIAGATPVPVPLTTAARHDLPAMAAAVGKLTRVILLCHPNNPTGPALHRDELEVFLDAVPPDVLVVLDEAYREFVTDPRSPDGLDLFRARGNVAVLRTFSKAYGLAGLRIGYVVAHSSMAAAARACAVPFGVSDLAQAAALASLAAADELAVRVETLIAERTRVHDELLRQGWLTPDCQGNFVWLPLGERTAEFAAYAESSGLMVRAFAPDGVRVTVGTPDVNDRFLEVAAGFGDPRTRASPRT